MTTTETLHEPAKRPGRGHAVPRSRLRAVNDVSFTLEPGKTIAEGRSEERRVGKECGYQCRSRWSPYH